MIEYLKKTFSPDHNAEKTLLDNIIILIIAFSILVVVVETESSIFIEYEYYFRALDNFFLVFFCLEYFIRLVFSGTNEKYKGFRGKLKYAFTPMAVIDFFAFAPLIFISGFNDTLLLRCARLIRLLRVAKFVARNRSILLLFTAINKSRLELYSVLAVTAFFIFIGAILLFFAERNIQPDAFGSIPRAMWWSMATLTTVGYGDVYPITGLGKLIASCMAILGIGIVALPAGIIAANFSKIMKSDDT